MHAAGTHGRDVLPERITAYIGGKVTVDRDDDFGIPLQHLLDRDGSEPAFGFTGDIARTEEFNGLDIDRAAEPGFQAARPAGIIDARALAFGNPVDARLDLQQRVFRIGGMGLGVALRQLAEQAIGRSRRIEAAVEQRIRNPGLLLHPRGERDKSRRGRADVKDEVRLERQHGFEIGGVAAAGETADLGAGADIRQHERAFFRPVGARPAEQQFRR